LASCYLQMLKSKFYYVSIQYVRNVILVGKENVKMVIQSGPLEVNYVFYKTIVKQLPPTLCCINSTFFNHLSLLILDSLIPNMNSKFPNFIMDRKFKIFLCFPHVILTLQGLLCMTTSMSYY